MPDHPAPEPFLPLRAHLFGEQPTSCGLTAAPPGYTLQSYLRACEKRYIEHCLAVHHQRVIETAEALGISRKGLWDKMRRLEIDKESAGG